jgi:hypothetical protein
MGRTPRDEGVASFREVLGDGLLDLFFGLLVAALVGISYLRGSTNTAASLGIPQTLFVATLIGLGALFGWTRHTVTYRRIDHPEQTGELRRRLAVVTLMVLMSLIAGAGLPFVLNWVPVLSEGYFTPILAIGVITLVSGTVAIAFASPRFWLYAALFGAPMLLQRTLARAGLPSSLGLYYGVAAAVAIVMGAVLFRRFLAQHPVLPKGHVPGSPAHA